MSDKAIEQSSRSGRGSNKGLIAAIIIAEAVIVALIDVIIYMMQLKKCG